MFYLQIGSGESHNIGLRFIPQQTQFVAQILIFINDSEDKNEETFCVNAVYRWPNLTEGELSFF